MPLKQPLETRFSDLPLILCGPIVRRVEPDLVSVWVALKEPREIILELYNGLCSPSDDVFSNKQVVFASDKMPTMAIGKNLHIAVVTIKNKEAVAPSVLPTVIMLNPNSVYSYNLIFTPNGTSSSEENLISLGLLKAPDTLGFKVGQLPSFIVAPAKLEDLRIAHGSCRKPHGKGRDGLAIAAQIMEPDFINEARIEKPTTRPHYFFHTGDQIYADDCSSFFIQHYTDAGNFLLGGIEELPYPKDPKSHFSNHTSFESSDWLRLTSRNVPPDRRATNYYSGFTGEEGNHLFSLGEFCAAYIFQWSDVLWLKKAGGEMIDLPTAEDLFEDRINDGISKTPTSTQETNPYLLPLNKNKNATEDQKSESEIEDQTGDDDVKVQVPSNWNELLDAARATTKASSKIVINAKKLYVKNRKREKLRVEEFRKGLKAVRRVFANVPAIMSFDDHDVTDDWYLNGEWTSRVLSNPLGETIIRNGLLAYALFQAWGNDPKAWEDKTPGKDTRAKLLLEIPELVKGFHQFSGPGESMSQSGPLKSDTAPTALIAAGKRLRKPLGFEPFTGFTDDDPRVKWHTSLKIGPTFAFVLDTRTRRDFSMGPPFPPNLIEKSSLLEQIPDNALPTGTELALVVSGAPVLGLALMEAIAQPVVSRIIDVVRAGDDLVDHEKKEVILKGRESLDVEHWSIHVAGFETMLKRCATLKKVLFLAGDVHYGITSEMDYWEKGESEPARFVQVVSSSLKNIKPQGQLIGVLPSGFVQVGLAGGFSGEFSKLTGIGWEEQSDIDKLQLRLQTEVGKFQDARPGQYPMRYSYALSKKPALITLRDWPLREYELGKDTPTDPTDDKTVVLPRIVFQKNCPAPSFRWKFNVKVDERPDDIRFKALTATFPNITVDLPVDASNKEAWTTGLEGMVLRNTFYSRNHMNRFINWYSHVAIVHFEKRSEQTFLLHSFFFIPDIPGPATNEPGNIETPFLRHEVSLAAKTNSDIPAFPLEP